MPAKAGIWRFTAEGGKQPETLVFGGIFSSSARHSLLWPDARLRGQDKLRGFLDVAYNRWFYYPVFARSYEDTKSLGFVTS